MKHLINAIYYVPETGVLLLCIEVTEHLIRFECGGADGTFTRTQDLRTFIMRLATGDAVVVGRLESHCRPPHTVSPERARQLDAMTMGQIEYGLLVGDLDENDRAYVLGTGKFG